MRKLIAICLAVFAVSVSAATATKKKPAMKAADHMVMTPDAMKWGDAPPFLEKGAQIVVLQGDPSKPGVFALRLRLPDGYRIAPHWHPTEERLTVISGTFNLAMGNSFDTSAGSAMSQGSYGYIEAKMHHYAWASGPTEVQVEGPGPFVLNYVNPNDDPRKAK
jgi:hypothetical protein